MSSAEESDEQRGRIQALMANREWAEAVRVSRRALMSSPERTDLRVLLAQGLLELGRFEEARAELVVLTREANEQGVVHRLLGETYLKSGQLHKARESLERAKALDPHDPMVDKLLAAFTSEASVPNVSRETLERWFDPDAVSTDVSKLDPADKTAETALPETMAAARPSDWEDVTSAGDARVTPHSLEVTAPRKPVRAPQSSASLLEAPTRSEIMLPDRDVREASDSGLHVDITTDASLTAPPLRALQEMARRGPDAPRVPTPSQPPVAPSPSMKPPSPTRGTAKAAEGGAPIGNARASQQVPSVPPKAPSKSPSSPGIAASPSSPGATASPSSPGATASPSGAGTHAAPGANAPSSAQLGLPGFLRPPDEPVSPPKRDDSRPFDFPQTNVVGGIGGGGVLARGPKPGFFDDPTNRRRVFTVLALLVPITILTLAIGGVGAYVWTKRRDADHLTRAESEATDQGVRAALDDALKLTEDRTDEPEIAALRARLLATLMFEHGEDRREEIEHLLAEGKTEAATLANRRIALAYLELASERADEALREVEAVHTTGPEAAELVHARAVAAAAVGDGPAAVELAQQATELRPSSARHAALLALLLARTGSPEEALRVLERVPEASRYAVLHAARARVLLTLPDQVDAARREAEIVLGPTFDGDAPVQRLWARLVRASCSYDPARPEATIREARALLRARPRADEAFDLTLADLLLRVGLAQETYSLLAGRRAYSMDAERRALLLAEAAMAANRLEDAERALEGAGSSLRADLVRGRIAEARGSGALALAAYERAASDPALAVTAKTRIGAIHLAAGRPREAAEALESVRTRAPADAEIVTLEVRAFIELGSLDLADRVLADALARRPNAPEFLASRGTLALSRGQVELALETLRAAARAKPADLAVQASLGEAARRGGQLDEARRALEAVLAAEPRNVTALAGLAQIALDQGRSDDVGPLLDRARQAGVPASALVGPMLSVAVSSGAGEGALAQARSALEGVADASLIAQLGRLELQAERDREASETFRRALEIDPTEPDALLGRAVIAIRTGDLAGATSRVDAAEASPKAAALGAAFRARVAAVRGRLRFENGDFAGAKARAEEAVGLDAACAEAHLLLASVALEQRRDPTDDLRHAVAGHAPPPEAVGRLAIKLATGTEACTLAHRYLAAAPQGYDASAVRAIAARCPAP